MALKFILVSLFIVSLNKWEVDAYGRLMDPVNRGSAWRVGFDTPANYEDMTNNCGGYEQQHKKNNGTCGICGDNYADSTPRANELGGKYDRGVIVRKYKRGSVIPLHVELTKNLNGGYFEFSICEPNLGGETEECFKPLTLSSGKQQYKLSKNEEGKINISAPLPADVFCSRCIIRWQYTAANEWGYCPDGTGKLGCGPQQMFRTCSDVSISH